MEPLQSFDFAQRRYACVWLQWVVGALLDSDLILVLRGAATSLLAGGAVIIKENVTRSEVAWYDDDDAYIVRSQAYLEQVTALAGLRVLSGCLQKDWDPTLMPVRMWCLVPA
jgi:protein N-terminal methyltransferase